MGRVVAWMMVSERSCSSRSRLLSPLAATLYLILTNTTDGQGAARVRDAIGAGPAAGDVSFVGSAVMSGTFAPARLLSLQRTRQLLFAAPPANTCNTSTLTPPTHALTLIETTGTWTTTHASRGGCASQRARRAVGAPAPPPLCGACALVAWGRPTRPTCPLLKVTMAGQAPRPRRP